ncbi:MAG: hypothetical protein SPJ65_10940 [Roseburia sp.]|nr:hypothetical protein [Roseburia sp.]
MRGPIRCPKCNKEIVLLHGVYCPYCGYDYSEWLMLPSRDARVINENETDYSGDAFITYDDGRVYNGDVFEGIPDGAGVMKLLDGRIISALWLDGEPLESMIVYMPNGSRYVGKLFYGMRHGNGLAYFPDGSYYDGMFIKDHITGKGTLFISNGDSYEGDFLNGEFDGVGVYRNRNKVYAGKFKRNVFTETGTIIFDTAKLYVFVRRSE